MSSQRWCVLWVGPLDPDSLTPSGSPPQRGGPPLHFERARNQAAALEAIREQEWDACVVDGGAEPGRGLELLSLLRAAAPELPMIFLRVGRNGSDADAPFAAGAADCLDRDHLSGDAVARAVWLQAERRRFERALEAGEEQLRHQARHDPLTGLPNRLLFFDRVGEALARPSDPHRSCAVLCLDLDRFQVVHDSLGHRQANELLVMVARRLAGCLEVGATLARLGGDEFAILLPDAADANEVTALAARIQRQLLRAFRIEEQDVFTSASIGIAVTSESLRTADDFVRAADLAMYRAKRQGRARHEIYDPEMHEQVTKRHQIEVDLRRALEQHEFRLYYQPILDFESGRSCGFEALVRWLHPKRGLVPPMDFLSVAEETGLIVPIGRFVLAEACRQMAEWNTHFAEGPPRYIAVNLSGKEFHQWDLPGRVQRILAETGLAADCLKIEITEGVLQESSPTPGDVLEELKTLGVDLFIDDFGTGYSSLSALHRFPIDALKIDRSFVSRMIEDDKSDAIVRTVLALAGHLGMTVVAEGVETEPQRDRLAALGCRQAQGYLFSKPLSAEDAEEYLRREARELRPDRARVA